MSGRYKPQVQSGLAKHHNMAFEGIGNVTRSMNISNGFGNINLQLNHPQTVKNQAQFSQRDFSSIQQKFHKKQLKSKKSKGGWKHTGMPRNIPSGGTGDQMILMMGNTHGKDTFSQDVNDHNQMEANTPHNIEISPERLEQNNSKTSGNRP